MDVCSVSINLPIARPMWTMLYHPSDASFICNIIYFSGAYEHLNSFWTSDSFLHHDGIQPNQDYSRCLRDSSINIAVLNFTLNCQYLLVCIRYSRALNDHLWNRYNTIVCILYNLFLNSNNVQTRRDIVIWWPSYLSELTPQEI